MGEGLGDAREEIGGKRQEGDELCDEALRAAVVPTAGGGDVTRTREENQNKNALDRVQEGVPHDVGVPCDFSTIVGFLPLCVIDANRLASIPRKGDEPEFCNHIY